MDQNKVNKKISLKIICENIEKIYLNNFGDAYLKHSSRTMPSKNEIRQYFFACLSLIKMIFVKSDGETEVNAEIRQKDTCILLNIDKEKFCKKFKRFSSNSTLDFVHKITKVFELPKFNSGKIDFSINKNFLFDYRKKVCFQNTFLDSFPNNSRRQTEYYYQQKIFDSNTEFIYPKAVIFKKNGINKWIFWDVRKK